MTAQVAHAERQHALLSASGAHRWLHCTPSAKLEELLPDTESEAAKRGTLAHEIAELKLRKYLEPTGPRKFNTAINKFKKHELYEPIIDTHTDVYVDYIKKLVLSYATAPYIAIEQKLDLSEWAPESFGTSDCVIIGGGAIRVIDYKNGQGVPVPAENNPQMLLYALGAYKAYSMLFAIETVHLSIVQPKVWDEPSEWTLPIQDLLAWGESIKPVAQQAFKGEGEYSVGDHCGFCRARNTCRARVAHLLSATDKAPALPPLINWDEAADILRRGDGLVKWYNSLKEAALSHVLAGGDVPGWKAVEGRGSRDYVNLDAAFAHLKANGIDEAVLYERKPITAASAEKVLTKKIYTELLEAPGHVIKKPGAPTLAPADDKRPAITDRVSAEQAFANG